MKPGITTYRGFATNNIDPVYQDHTSTEKLPTAVNSEAIRNELQSFFGRVNYIYANKYMFTGTLRADGSSSSARITGMGISLLLQ